MKNIDDGAKIKRVYSFWGGIIVFFAVLVLMAAFVLSSDDKAYCLDLGKVYDPIKKICRSDCLTWNEEIGCVPITDENREKKARGEL